MSIDSTPAFNSIDSAEGLQEAFTADIRIPVAEELVLYGMVSTLLLIFLIHQNEFYSWMRSSTMRRSNLWDRAKNCRKEYKN